MQSRRAVSLAVPLFMAVVFWMHSYHRAQAQAQPQSTVQPESTQSTRTVLQTGPRSTVTVFAIWLLGVNRENIRDVGLSHQVQIPKRKGPWLFLYKSTYRSRHLLCTHQPKKANNPCNACSRGKVRSQVACTAAYSVTAFKCPAAIC